MVPPTHTASAARAAQAAALLFNTIGPIVYEYTVRAMHRCSQLTGRRCNCSVQPLRRHAALPPSCTASCAIAAINHCCGAGRSARSVRFTAACAYRHRRMDAVAGHSALRVPSRARRQEGLLAARRGSAQLSRTVWLTLRSHLPHPWDAARACREGMALHAPAPARYGTAVCSLCGLIE